MSRLLRNQRGLLFTSKPEDEVLDFFGDHSEADFLRTGGIAGTFCLSFYLFKECAEHNQHIQVT